MPYHVLPHLLPSHARYHGLHQGLLPLRALQASHGKAFKGLLNRYRVSTFNLFDVF